ncbi:hypothetical protein M153_423000134, partial [Pseudoloma neurophilia]
MTLSTFEQIRLLILFTISFRISIFFHYSVSSSFYLDLFDISQNN